MRLDPPKVLLERSFLAAVRDPLHPEHAASVARYLDLLDRFEREEVLLVAVSSHLRDLERGPHPLPAQRIAWFVHRRHRGVFAPVEPLYVGAQHRRAAARLVASGQVTDPEAALTLVMCDRHQLYRIASVDDTFDRYDLEQDPPIVVEQAASNGSADE